MEELALVSQEVDGKQTFRIWQQQTGCSYAYVDRPSVQTVGEGAIILREPGPMPSLRANSSQHRGLSKKLYMLREYGW